MRDGVGKRKSFEFKGFFSIGGLTWESPGCCSRPFYGAWKGMAREGWWMLENVRSVAGAPAGVGVIDGWRGMGEKAAVWNTMAWKRFWRAACPR